MSLFDKFSKSKKKDEVITDTQEDARYNMMWLMAKSSTHNLRISQDTARVSSLLDGLSKTGGYCPCVPRYVRDNTHMCPCLTVRTGGGCHCGLFDCGSTGVVASTEVVCIRRHSEPQAQTYLELVPVSTSTSDDQTLVIQYDDPSDLNAARTVVEKYKRRTSFSIVDRWRQIDIFIPLGGGIRGKTWVRIVYECMRDNPNPSPNNDRFPGAYIARLRRVLDKPSVTLDMLLEGR